MIRGVLGLLHADSHNNLFSDHTRERLSKLLSPRYLVDKAAQIVYERTHPDYPWFTRDAIERFEAWLQPSYRGLEWGSGRSTPWVARRCASLVTVEHQRLWYDRVSSQLAAAGLRNVDYRLVEESAYAKVADEFPDGHFDFVIVDGLFRDETLLRSIPKLRAGGWLVFDNANWYLRHQSRTPHSLPPAGEPKSPGFAKVEHALADWSATWTTNGVNETLLLEKTPNHAVT
jgi:SAM-dependent methyltransferase